MNDLYPAVRRGVATSALWIAVAASTACQHRAVSPGPTGSHTDASDNSVRPAQPSVSIGVLAADWARWPMPNPPSTGLPNAQSYDVGAADVVVDRVTGLRWQRRIGKTDMLWKEAAAYCAGLGIEGAHDWRLPTFIELTSLVDFTRVVPAIDLVAFPDPIQGNFWTSTAVAAAAGEAWYVAFSTGFNYQGHQDFLRLGARCLRSGARADSAGGGRYSDVAAAVVRDAGTGLTWQRAVDATTTYGRTPWRTADR